jgi:hypothetical protein
VKTRDLFFRILTVMAGMEILVILILGSTSMREGMGKNLVDTFLLSLLSVPLLSSPCSARENPGACPSRRTFRVKSWKRKWS